MRGRLEPALPLLSRLEEAGSACRRGRACPGYRHHDSETARSAGAPRAFGVGSVADEGVRADALDAGRAQRPLERRHHRVGRPERYVAARPASGTVCEDLLGGERAGARPGPADGQVLGHLRRDHDDPASGGHELVTVGEVVDARSARRRTTTSRFSPSAMRSELADERRDADAGGDEQQLARVVRRQHEVAADRGRHDPAAGLEREQRPLEAARRPPGSGCRTAAARRACRCRGDAEHAAPATRVGVVVRQGELDELPGLEPHRRERAGS